MNKFVCIQCGEEYEREHRLRLCPECNGKRVSELAEKLAEQDERWAEIATKNNQGARDASAAWASWRQITRTVAK